MQTKLQSLIEAITNTAIGFIISLMATFAILPLLGIESTPLKNLKLTIFFTVISILRSYIIRRWFNKTKVTRVEPTEWLHCFECETDMPTKERDGDTYCANCGLIHRNFY